MDSNSNNSFTIFYFLIIKPMSEEIVTTEETLNEEALETLAEDALLEDAIDVLESMQEEADLD